MKRRRQTQGSITFLLFIVLTLVLIGVVGWVAWRSILSSSEPLPYGSEKAEQTTKPESAPEPGKGNHEGYLVVEEWGIKIKMRDADKVNISISNQEATFPWNGISYSGALGILIKDEYVPNYICKDNDIGASLYRSSKEKGFYQEMRMSDGYVYFITGAPGACSDTQAEVDLQFRLLEDLRLENIEILN